MKFLKTLGVLGGLVLLMFIGTVIGFEFIKSSVMPHLSADLAGNIEAGLEPADNPLGKLILGGSFLIILNWVFGLSKWLHKGINILVNAPLALSCMAFAIYGVYGAYLVVFTAQAIPNLAQLGNLFALFVLALFWLLISVKVNVFGKHLFQPKDWEARKKVVEDTIDKVEEELGIDTPDAEAEGEEVRV